MQLARAVEKWPADPVRYINQRHPALSLVVVAVVCSLASRRVNSKPCWPVAAELEEVIEVNEAKCFEVSDEGA